MLKLDKISFSYGDLKVLWDIDLQVSAGEIVSIVGSNGAGKSTILKNIAGLVTPISGQITFNNENVTPLSVDARVEKGLVLVPEARRIFPEMTVKENLWIGGYTPHARKNREENIKKAFDQFPILKERSNQLGGTLSGGEQQMLAISRGLMAEPKLLMLDEPSLGLSPMMVQTIFRVITEIAKQGVTILLIEQNVNQSLKIATRASILETGRVTLTGPGSELLNNPHVRKAFLGL